MKDRLLKLLVVILIPTVMVCGLNYYMHLKYGDCYHYLYNRHVSTVKVLKQEGVIPQNIEDFDEMEKLMKPQRLQHLKELDKNLDNAPLKIPAILHVIWLTAAHNPRELAAEHVDRMIENTKVLPLDGQKWEFILWTNDKKLIPKTVSALEGYFKIKEMSDLDTDDHKLVKKVYEAVDKQFFGVSSDTLRYMIMKRYGGLYTDIDIDIYYPPTKLMKAYNFFSSRNIRGHAINNGIFANSPDHPIMNSMIKLVRRNLLVEESDVSPEYLANACDIITQEFYVGGPETFAIGFYKGMNQNGNVDISFEPGVLFANKKTERPKNIVLKDYTSKNIPQIGQQHYSFSWESPKHGDKPKSGNILE